MTNYVEEVYGGGVFKNLIFFIITKALPSILFNRKGSPRAMNVE